jgi:hypothetical protein
MNVPLWTDPANNPCSTTNHRDLKPDIAASTAKEATPTHTDEVFSTSHGALDCVAGAATDAAQTLHLP